VRDSLLDPLRVCAREIAEAVRPGARAGFSGERASQYHLDLAADEVAVRVLTGAGFRVVSEESGVTGVGTYTVVVDPIDGSTNCDHGIPFYATSLAVVFQGELVAALVANQATGTHFEAERGQGAARDGVAIAPSGVERLERAVAAFSGLPRRHLGWAQFRALGAAALEMCLVADGSLDLFTVARGATLHPWDYLGGALIAREAGAVVDEWDHEEIVTTDVVRRRIIVAATSGLLDEVRALGAP
jgi:myo-inositol-1(or 4)-monophosphatase